MASLPPLSHTRPHAGPGVRLCLRANRWGALRAVGTLFRWISRLGDGAFWYGLMAALSLFGGPRGLRATAAMAVAGLLALGLYRLLKNLTRRPRPFRSIDGIVAHLPPLDEFSFPSGHTLQAVSFSLVACADSTTATSNSKGSRKRSSVRGCGSSAARRLNRVSIAVVCS